MIRSMSPTLPRRSRFGSVSGGLASTRTRHGARADPVAGVHILRGRGLAFGFDVATSDPPGWSGVGKMEMTMAKTMNTPPVLRDECVVLSGEVQSLLDLPEKGEPYVVDRSWVVAALADTIAEAESCVRLLQMEGEANAA